MKTFEEAVPESFTERDGYLSFRFGDGQRYELALEPIFGGGYMMALYEQFPGEPYGSLLLADKVPVRPILRGESHQAARKRLEKVQP